MNFFLLPQLMCSRVIYFNFLLLVVSILVSPTDLFCQQQINSSSSDSKFFGLENLEVLQKDYGPMSWEDARSLEYNSINGWRIPNREELRLLYEYHRKTEGNFQSKVYWSSEGTGNSAWAILFRNGEERTIDKKSLFLVKLIRFSPEWIKKKEKDDSLKNIQIQKEKAFQKRLDSISQIKRRRLDSIATIEKDRREQVARKQKQIEDSLNLVELKKSEIVNKRELYRKSLRLNYVGFGLGYFKNQNLELLSQSSNKVWSFLTDPNQAIDGETADGQGLSTNMVIGIGILKNLGLEIGWESKTDGSVEIKDQSGLTYLSESKNYKLLKQTSFYAGPQITFPISNQLGINFDLKYQVLYSKSKINDVLKDPIETQSSGATGSNLGVGLRFSIKGLNNYDRSHSEQEQIQIGYEKQKVTHDFKLGEIQFDQNLFFIKYIYTF